MAFKNGEKISIARIVTMTAYRQRSKLQIGRTSNNNLAKRRNSSEITRKGPTAPVPTVLAGGYEKVERYSRGAEKRIKAKRVKTRVNHHRVEL
jgi:hypothetical protein